MRRVLVAGAVAVLAVGVSWSAAAATGGGRTPLRCQDSVWRTTAVSTSSKHWVRVPTLADSPSAIFPVVVNVSATVSGAPVQFRLRSTNIGGQTRISRPGATRFVPVGGRSDAFAYQWVEPNQSAAEHAIELRLQWRSPSGQPVHLLRGTLTAAYTTTACTGSG